MDAAPTHCMHLVAGTISLPEQGFFSPFPRGTGSLSVAKEYLALSGGPDRFTQSFTCTALLGIPLGDVRVFAHPALTVYGRCFQIVPLPQASPNIGAPLPGRDRPPGGSGTLIWEMPRVSVTIWKHR